MAQLGRDEAEAFHRTLDLLFAYAARFERDDHRERASHAIARAFGMSKEEAQAKLAGATSDDPTAETRALVSPEAAILAVARSLAPPRDHHGRKLLHQAARALNLGPEAIAGLAKAHPALAIQELALPWRRRRDKPKPARPFIPRPLEAPTAEGPRDLAFWGAAAALMIVGLVVAVLGPTLPRRWTSLACSESVRLVDEAELRGQDRGASKVTNRLGPVRLREGAFYRAVLRVRRAGSTPKVRVRLAVKPAVGKGRVPVEPGPAPVEEGDFLVAQLGSFTVAEEGDYRAEVRAVRWDAEDKGTFLVLCHPLHGWELALTAMGLGLVALGLVLFASRGLLAD